MAEPSLPSNSKPPQKPPVVPSTLHPPAFLYRLNNFLLSHKPILFAVSLVSLILITSAFVLGIQITPSPRPSPLSLPSPAFSPSPTATASLPTDATPSSTPKTQPNTSPKLAPMSTGFYLTLEPSATLTYEVKPPSQGWNLISATLKNSNNDIVLEQPDIKYSWSVANTSIATVSPFSKCYNSIKPPCPQDHALLTPLTPGKTTITVTAVKNGQPLARATYNLTINPQATDNPQSHTLPEDTYTISFVYAPITMPVSPPGQTYGTNAQLKDSSGNIVTNQTNLVYAWSIDNPNLATVYGSSICAYGIQPPCPAINAQVTGIASGTTTLRVAVYDAGILVAKAQTSLTITP